MCLAKFLDKLSFEIFFVSTFFFFYTVSKFYTNIFDCEAFHEIIKFFVRFDTAFSSLFCWTVLPLIYFSLVPFPPIDRFRGVCEVFSFLYGGGQENAKGKMKFVFILSRLSSLTPSKLYSYYEFSFWNVTVIIDYYMFGCF